MPELSKIAPEDFDSLFDKYLRDDDPRLCRNDWQALFQPICQSCEQPEYGYKLTEDGKIVGMLGMLSSVRILGDRRVPFCNLHSWFVDEEYRGNSLLLMRPILRMKDHVITDFTPTPAVIKISLKLGFKLLNSSQMILRSKAQRATGTDRCRLNWNEDIDQGRLTPTELQVLLDHPPDRFFTLLVSSDREQCLLVIRRVEFHWKPYASVLYASSPSFLLKTQGNWQNEIRARLKVKRIVGDQKTLPPLLVGNRKFPYCVSNQLYRSNKVGPENIDTLYSEVSMLGLTTLPGMKTVFRRALGVFPRVR